MIAPIREPNLGTLPMCETHNCQKTMTIKQQKHRVRLSRRLTGALKPAFHQKVVWEAARIFRLVNEICSTEEVEAFNKMHMLTIPCLHGQTIHYLMADSLYEELVTGDLL